MSVLDRVRACIVLWVRARVESWATPDIEDYIDPSWQRHPGLIRAAHPKVEPEVEG